MPADPGSDAGVYREIGAVFAYQVRKRPASDVESCSVVNQVTRALQARDAILEGVLATRCELRYERLRPFGTKLYTGAKSIDRRAHV